MASFLSGAEILEESKEDGNKSGGAGGAAATGGGDDEGNMERKTKRKLARGAWAIAKEKAQIHMSSEKIQAYEVAFEKIREITGIADIEVLVDRFIEAEERNFSTFKYISHLNKELEKLDTQIHEARFFHSTSCNYRKSPKPGALHHLFLIAEDNIFAPP